MPEAGMGRHETNRLAWHQRIYVAVVFDVFHLCGMVSKDTGACGSQSENAFVVEIIFIHATKI